MTTFNVATDAEFDAALLAAHDGDAINLAAGNYSAQHIVNVDVRITGAANHLSELSGGLEVNHSGVAVDGVLVTGSNNFSGAIAFGAGIYVTAAGTGAVIQRASFDGDSGSVGLVTNATGLTIVKNAFEGYNNGIYLVASATGTIHDNVFTQAGGTIGIQTESTGVQILHNKFFDGGAGGAAVFSTPTGSVDGSTFIRSDNMIQSILPAHGVNIDVSGAGAFTVDGTNFDDAIYTADDPNHVAALTINGHAGSDEIWGGAAGDTLTGGLGNDILHGQGGNDTFAISGTNDTFDTFDGGAGLDRILVTGMKAVTLHGFDATADSVQSWVGNGQELLGTTVDDTFNLSGLTAVAGLTDIDGGKGNDTITGSNAWSGILKGNLGMDTLHGGALNDTLDGGKDKVADAFKFNTGDAHDTIVNFIATAVPSAADDHIDLTGFGTNYTTDVHNHMTQVGKDVVIDFGGGDMLTIVKTTISFLDAHSADFHLA